MVCLLLSTEAAEAQAQATTTVTHEAIADTAGSGVCESIGLISYEGHKTTVQHTTQTPQGTLLIRFHVTTGGVGVQVDTGEQFVFRTQYSEVYHVADPAELANIQLTRIEHVRFMGPNGHLTMRAIFHTTLNSDGTVTVIFDRFERVCR